MNPKYLLGSDQELVAETKKYLDAFKDVPYIFNLGHGIVPETPPEMLNFLLILSALGEKDENCGCSL